MSKFIAKPVHCLLWTEKNMQIGGGELRHWFYRGFALLTVLHQGDTLPEIFWEM